MTRENALTSAIAPPSWAQSVASVVTGKSSIAEGVGKGLLTNMPWRKYGVKYVQNEVYFDIIEEINVCIDKKGKSTSTDVNGRIECTSHLSGTPDIAMDFRNSNALGKHFYSSSLFQTCFIVLVTFSSILKHLKQVFFNPNKFFF